MAMAGGHEAGQEMPGVLSDPAYPLRTMPGKGSFHAPFAFARIIAGFFAEINMEVIINGNTEFGDYSTVAELLNARNILPNTVVVELNGKILPATDFAITTLKEGDSLEIIEFVAGG